MKKRTSRHTWPRIGAILIAFGLLAAACSSSGDDATDEPAGNRESAEPAQADEGDTPPADDAPSEDAAVEEELDVGVLIFATTVPYLAAEANAIEETGVACRFNVDVQNGEFDIAKQIAVIQQFVTQKKDAIIVNASDPDALIPVLKQANDAGIPVFAAASVINEGADIISTSAADNFEFGRLQGQLLIEAVGEEARVAYITGVLGSQPVILRRAGFMEVIDQFPGIEILEENSANWDFSQALTVTQNMLTKYREGEIDAIVDQGPEGVTGANFAREAGRTDVTFVLGDQPDQVKEAILDGTVYGTVLQDPIVQGTDAMDNVCNYLRGNESDVVTGSDFTPLEIITIENVADSASY
jgi:ribose transport system substrate-binding protein